MTVEDVDVVDFITVDRETGHYWLSISDHLPWDDTNEHLLVLQEKINTYISFVESGELSSSFPEAITGELLINIGFKYPPSDLALEFLDAVRTVLLSLGIGLNIQLPTAN